MMSINFEFNAVGTGFSFQVPSIHSLATELCVAVMMALQLLGSPSLSMADERA